MTHLALLLALALLASCRTVPPALIDVQETQTEIATQAAIIEGAASALASDTAELALSLDAIPIPAMVKVQAQTVDAAAARLAALASQHAATIERQTTQIAEAARAEVTLVQDRDSWKDKAERRLSWAITATSAAALLALLIAAAIVLKVKGLLKI